MKSNRSRSDPTRGRKYWPNSDTRARKLRHSLFFDYSHTKRLRCRFVCVYYHRFFVQVWRQLLDFGKEQLVGLILALLILISQIHYGVITKDALHSNELSIFWPYILVFAGYFTIQIMRAPVVLDSKHSQEIANKTREIAELANENRQLKNPDKPVTFQFTQVLFGQKQNTPVIIVYAKVLNHGSALTLHDIRLTAG